MSHNPFIHTRPFCINCDNFLLQDEYDEGDVNCPNCSTRLSWHDVKPVAQTSDERSIHGETIAGVKYHHDDQWILFLMKSSRVYKITTASYYGGESDVQLNEVDKEEWDNVQ